MSRNDREPVGLRWLPESLRRAEKPVRAIFVGWLMAFLPSIAAAALVQALFEGRAGPEISGTGPRLLFMLVIFAPFVETLIMAGALSLLLKVVRPAAAVVISAAGWGLAHSALAPAWGLVIWWPFLIFSTLYVTWRGRSLAAAIAIPAIVHALQNSIPAILITSGIGR